MRKFKERTSYFGKGVKLTIIAEAALFFGSYLLWRSLNNSQAKRYQYYKKHPKILEFYYKVGESIGGNTGIREYDQMTWAKVPEHLK